MKFTRNMLLLLVLALALSLAACGAEKEEPETQATTYRVWVRTEAGTPVKGAMVQLCTDVCIPGVTDEEGKAEFSVPEDSYKVSFAVLPKGYEYADDVREYYFAEGSTELTLCLKETD